MAPLANGALFLIQSIFDVYLFMMMLRVIFQWVHADFRNPLVQFIAKLTTPPLRLIRKAIPFFRGVDIGAIIILILLELIKFILVILLGAGKFPAIGGLVVLAFAELLHQMISIFFYSTFIFVILSWFAPMINPALMQVLYQITEPLMRPARRIIPPIAGLDLSPIPVLILLKLIQIMVTQPLLMIGYGMAVRSLMGH